METLKAISKRISTRSYKVEQISEKELNTVLGAGSAAPVGFGAYDNYRLTVIQNAALLDRITKATAAAFNNTPQMSNALYGAPTLIVLSGKPNHDMPGLEIASTACIAETMLIAATDIGLASIYLCGFLAGFTADPDLLKVLDLPEGFAPIAGILLGYSAQPITAEKDLKPTLNINRIV